MSYGKSFQLFNLLEEHSSLTLTESFQLVLFLIKYLAAFLLEWIRSCHVNMVDTQHPYSKSLAGQQIQMSSSYSWKIN